MQVQRALDPTDMTELEKKHTPVITADVAQGIAMVVVGYIPHPMEEDHHIEWIELYKDDDLVERIELEPTSEAKAVFKINLDGQFRAISSCNQHGVWESL